MWKARGSSRTPDRSANLDAQLTLMNARAAQAIAGSKERRPLAGDQLYVDLDLSIENLPAGTRLAVGDAVIEVTRRAAHRLRQVQRPLRDARRSSS